MLMNHEHAIMRGILVSIRNNFAGFTRIFHQVYSEHFCIICQAHKGDSPPPKKINLIFVEENWHID